MLAANRTRRPPAAGRLQPAPLPRRHLRRPRLRLRPAQLLRPGRRPGRDGPGAPPGGRLAMLEVDAPTLARPAHRLRRLVQPAWSPRIGAALSDRDAYDYLPRSVAYLPPHAGAASHAGRGGLLRCRHPPPRGRPQPAHLRHPSRRARADDRPGLHARTVALDYGPDALQFDGSPTVLFDRPGLTLVGWGTALLVEADEAAARAGRHPLRRRRRSARARAWWRSGALPFLARSAGPSHRPPLHHGHRPGPRRHHPPLGHRRRARPTCPCPRPTSSSTRSSGSTATARAGASEDVRSPPSTPHLSRAGYRDAGGARRWPPCGRPDAALRKVVLARSVTAALERPAPPLGRPAPAAGARAGLHHLLVPRPRRDLLRRLARAADGPSRAPDLRATRWPAPSPGARPPGPTPTPRGAWPARPRTGPSTATWSTASRAALRPLCDELTVPDEPSLVAFRSVAHLGTRIEGQPGRARHHRPRPARAACTRRRPSAARPGTWPWPPSPPGEPVRRGYWAGPVGWVDADGDGEWMIGIRSARLHPDGRTITLHAGAGRGGRLRPRGRSGRDRRQAGVGARVPGARRLGAPALSGGAATAARRTAAGASGMRTTTEPRRRGRGHLGRPAERLGDGPHDGQPQAGPRARPGRVATVEAVEDPRGAWPGRCPARCR